MTTRVALVGASGKLGRVLAAEIAKLDGFALALPLGSRDDLDRIGEADLVVDASTLEVSTEVVRRCVAFRKNLLIATSGWSSERVDEIRNDVAVSGIGVVIVPNFSVGSVLASLLATVAGNVYDSIEIIETHRDTKIDSPSGTAVRTAEMIAAAREEAVSAPFADQPARGQLVSGIAVHSLRRPGVLARQEVILSGPGESVTLVHETFDSAEAYAKGIRLAVSFAVSARGITYGLDKLFDIPGITIGARSE